MFKFPPFQGEKAIVQVYLPSGVLYTRVETLVRREGQSELEQMACSMIGDTLDIRQEVQRLLATGEYKYLDLRRQIPSQAALKEEQNRDAIPDASL